MVALEPLESVSPETVIVRPLTDTLPVLARVYPFAAAAVLGADHPAGTSTVTEPLELPPVAAVKVKTTVFPVEPFATEFVGVVTVPEPSAERMVTLGEDARSVSEPAELERSFACQL